MVDPSALLASASINLYKSGLENWRSSPRRRLRRRLNDAIGHAPGDATTVLESLIADCDLRAYDARRASKWWNRSYYLLGLPAAVLATISGAAGLASTAGRVPAAIAALLAAGFATAATFLNSNENRQLSLKLSAAWQELADDVRLAIISNSNQVGSEMDWITEVIKFNKRKSALLRGEVPTFPEGNPSPAV